MPDTTETRIRELERKVNLLTAVVVVEAVLLSGLFPFFAVALVLLLPILVFTHHFLPGLARRLGRLMAAKQRSSTAASGT